MFNRLLSYVGVPNEIPVEPEPPADESDEKEAKFVELLVERHPEGKWMDIEDQTIHPNGVSIIVSVTQQNFVFYASSVTICASGIQNAVQTERPCSDYKYQ